MPLYLDFHKELIATMEQVVMAHLADLAVQEKFGVKYHKYWLDLTSGTAFCLIEGPNREACEAVHLESSGHTACQLVEVDPTSLESFMGRGYSVDDGPMLHSNGTIDLGYRNILLLKMYSKGGEKKSQSLSEKISTIINKHRGRIAPWSQGTMGVFSASADALECAQALQFELKHEQDVNFKIGLGAGKPLTGDRDFFEQAIKIVQRLCWLAGEQQVMVSSLSKMLCPDKQFTNAPTDGSFKFLNESEEDLMDRWFSITEDQLSDENFNIENICRQIGMSRPQLYRKITHLTGRSPNDLLRDQRMEKAFELLKKKSYNVSEVALEVGYNSPSYFAKCFTKRFGYSPSQL
jgi:AraC-like DNA-binding protein